MITRVILSTEADHLDCGGVNIELYLQSHPPLVGYQDVSYNRPLTGRGRGGLNLAPGSGRDGYGPQGTWQERTQGGLSAQGTGQAAQYTGRFLAGKGTCSKWCK